MHVLEDIIRGLQNVQHEPSRLKIQGALEPFDQFSSTHLLMEELSAVANVVIEGEIGHDVCLLVEEVVHFRGRAI